MNLRRGLAISALLLLPACRAPKPPRGIVLITLDTTRADHLGCYGYRDGATPRLDGLASEGVLFADAMAAVPTTLASHATLFTGEYPPVHGVRYNGMFVLGPESVTVAELLREAGWRTAAVPAAYPVNATTGLDQGFEIYRDLYREADAKRLKLSAQRSAEDVANLGIAWLKTVEDRHFFLWLHFYDPHARYEPPFPFSARFRERPYDGEIAYVDSEVGRVLDALRDMGLGQDTAVVVVGDHGEGLYDHGEGTHGDLVYQSTLRVPLLVRTPGGGRGLVVHDPVSLVDVAPTILDLAGLAPRGSIDGTTLVPALRGDRPAARPIYFEALTGSLLYGWSPLEGIRRGAWKLIRSREPELFDLSRDPGELANLAATEAPRTADMIADLDADLARWSKVERAAASAAPLDREALTRLASLGYVGGDVTTGRRGGANPRELVHLESELLQLRDAMSDGDFPGALVAADDIVKADPTNRFALHESTVAYASMGDRAAARARAQRLVEIYPEYVAGVVLLGSLEIAAKRMDSAEAVFRKGLATTPHDPALLHPLSLALLGQGKDQQARAVVNEALAAPKAPPVFRVTLALCLARAGDAAGAERELNAAIAAGYGDRAALETEPMLAPLRAVPGYAAAMARIKGAS